MCWFILNQKIYKCSAVFAGKPIVRETKIQTKKKSRHISKTKTTLSCSFKNDPEVSLQSGSPIFIDDGHCHKCTNTDMANTIKCAMCKRTFHGSCLSLSHNTTSVYINNKDDTPFICKECWTIVPTYIGTMQW